MLDTHWVGLSSFSSTPRLSRRSSSSLSLPFTATGTRRGGITTGGTVSSTSKCSLPSILPRPLNRSAYSARTCSSVRLLMLSSMILGVGWSRCRMFWCWTTRRFIFCAVSAPSSGSNPSSTTTNSAVYSILLHGFRMWTLAVPNTLSLDLE